MSRDFDAVPREVGNGSEDTTLVARVLRGDTNAFEPLVRKHQATLFRRARWMGLDADTAADMVQDAFVKAYRSLRSCRDPERFGHWVAKILRNRILDHMKSPDRRRGLLPFSMTANTSDPEAEESRAALQSLLQEALAYLPVEQREAFLMKHAEEMSYEDMADLTGTSVSAMKMRVHRAREALSVYPGLASFQG